MSGGQVVREQGKETTILSEAQGIGRMLSLLNVRLNSQFNRKATPYEETREQRVLPETNYYNVLDEILAQLEEDRLELQHILEYLDSQVLPKIS